MNVTVGKEMVMCYLRERVDDIERNAEDIQNQLNRINAQNQDQIDFTSGDFTFSNNKQEHIPLLSRSWSPTTNSYSQASFSLKRSVLTNKSNFKVPFASTSRQFSFQGPLTTNTGRKGPPPLLSRHTQYTFDETDLRHELETWKKAHDSLPGITRDEKSVQKVLRQKVMALDGLLHQ